MSRVAVVTGANRGIGLAIIHKLQNALKCKNFDLLLTSRNEYLGRKAVKDLKEKDINVSYHQLDICDDSSVKELASFLKEKYGGLDILVNNAGVLHGHENEHFEDTMRTNFFKTVDVCETLFPLFRSHSRVVNMGSVLGIEALQGCSNGWRKVFTNPKSMEDLLTAMKEYIAASKVGTQHEHGFPISAFGMSKLGILAMTSLQQKEFDADPKRKDLIVNSVHPGYVATISTNNQGTISPEEDAETPCFAALLTENVTGPKGQFLVDSKPVTWQ